MLKRLVNVLLVAGWLLQALSFPSSVGAQHLANPSIPAYPCNRTLFDFADGNQGWFAEDNYGRIVSSAEDIPQSPEGAGGLSFRLNLRDNKHSSAQFLVDLYRSRPGCAQDASIDTAWWEPESILSVWVWAPSGTRGSTTDPNGLHLFVVDDKGNKFYGTWQTIQENTWFEVTLRLGGEGSPACGDPKNVVDFSHIRKIGLNISLNTNNGVHPINDIIRMSPVHVKPGKYESPNSQHLYTFDKASETQEFPEWQIVQDPSWKAAAFKSFSATEGALTVNAEFHAVDGEDPNRKGVMGLYFAPDMDLKESSNLQDFISLDIKFDPQPDFSQAPCPFSLKLWVFGSSQKITFSSIDQNVGSSDWTRVAFRLADLMPQPEADPATTPDISRIGAIGFQIWDNVQDFDYQGTILVDNIAIGGDSSVEVFPEISFVDTEEKYFSLDGQRFRFIGANAEYLATVPDSVVEDVLDHAQEMGILVIRTWGFSDGCEDYNLESCESSSRYFQPQPGVYNNSAFEHFDHIIYEARKRNIRLIIPLANNWYEYGGIPRYVCWKTQPGMDTDCNTRTMSDELHDSFYTDDAIKEWYREYIYHFVNRVNTLTGVRYADDPTIMAWELINEPRAKSDPTGATLHGWIVEMSTYLSGLAPNQLIGTGEEGWYIMSKEQADQSIAWQDFDKNYWHYGVNWVLDTCEKSWGSNGVDFRSDHSSTPQIVEWQTQVKKDDTPMPQSQTREAVPEVDFTGIHLYPAPGETGLARVPYCSYYGLDSLCQLQMDPPIDTSNASSDHYRVHQAREWIAQHVMTSHDTLNKPFVLEEFNFPVQTKATDSNAASANEKAMYQVTQEERARLFTQYLDIAYELDVDGVLFWNLGYDGFLKQQWIEIDALKKWTDGTGKELFAKELNTIQLNYDPALNPQKTTMQLAEPNVDWLRGDNSKVMLILDNQNGNAQTVSFKVQYSDGSVHPSEVIAIHSGKNEISLDKIFRQEQKDTEDVCPKPKEDAPLVTGMSATLTGYTVAGTALFDFHTIFNNKYVIYPGDPVEKVINLAAGRLTQNTVATQPSARINAPNICDSRINPHSIQGPLQFSFDIVGSLEHPDGDYYRYQVDGPKSQSTAGFNKIGENSLAELSVDASVPGKYEISIAPEGFGVDSPGADSCYFEVMNSIPVLNIDQVQIDGQDTSFQENRVTAPLSGIQMRRNINIQLSGTDDFSKDLEIGCELRKWKTKVANQEFSCRQMVSATTPLGTTGTPVSITGRLLPGHYQLQVWLTDQDRAVSEMTNIRIAVLYPFYVYFLLTLVLGAILLFFFKRAWANPEVKRRIRRQVE